MCRVELLEAPELRETNQEKRHNSGRGTLSSSLVMRIMDDFCWCCLTLVPLMWCFLANIHVSARPRLNYFFPHRVRPSSRTERQKRKLWGHVPCTVRQTIRGILHFPHEFQLFVTQKEIKTKKKKKTKLITQSSKTLSIGISLSSKIKKNRKFFKMNLSKSHGILMPKSISDQFSIKHCLLLCIKF